MENRRSDIRGERRVKGRGRKVVCTSSKESDEVACNKSRHVAKNRMKWHATKADASTSDPQNQAKSYHFTTLRDLHER
eukprot:5066444-Pleurochrysis_carterae.AAC.5